MRHKEVLLFEFFGAVQPACSTCGFSGRQHYHPSAAFMFYFNVSNECCFPCLPTEIVLGNEWATFPILIGIDLC